MRLLQKIELCYLKAKFKNQKINYIFYDHKLRTKRASTESMTSFSHVFVA